MLINSNNSSSAAAQQDIEIFENEENSKKSLRFPKSIGFLWASVFFERINYYGLRSILVVYLTKVLLWDEHFATIVYHSMLTLIYLLSCLGGLISDSWYGKSKTVMVMSSIVIIGMVQMFLTVTPFMTMAISEITMLALIHLALGVGGLHACQVAMGGDQFNQPLSGQAKQIKFYFSVLYCFINLGAFVGIIVPPILVNNMTCFERDDCYAAGFGITLAMMVLSVAIFSIGKRFFTITLPTGNMFVLVLKCISKAIIEKIKTKSSDCTKSHWLDYAEISIPRKLIQETKILLNILVLYLPLPIFWSLFEQQGSTWTLQALRLTINNNDGVIQPGQMQMLNPILILILVPLVDIIINPLLSKLGLRHPLQKMALGGILISLSFIAAAILEYQLDNLVDQQLENISLFWQIPQYILLSLGEVLFSITGLAFTFSQAPANMRTILQSFWFVTIGFGNLINVIVVFFVSSSINSSQVFTFLLFACAMLIAVVIFMVLSYQYEPIEQVTEEDSLLQPSSPLTEFNLQSVALNTQNDHEDNIIIDASNMKIK